MDIDKKTPLEYLSEIQELVDATEYMDDKILTEAIAMTVKLAMQPDVPASVIARLIVQFEAYASMAGLQGRSLMILPVGKDPAKRKGFYLSAAEKFSAMAAALKYMAR